MKLRFAGGSTGLVLVALSAGTAAAQVAFAVATIRPSAESVKFERDGRTDVTPGHLLMRDVTVSTCIKWAYGVQRSQVVGPPSLEQDHFDMEAKADGPVDTAQMKAMMQTLLAERFKLTFHRENRELHGFALTVAPGGSKLHDAESDGPMFRQNTATGMVARSMTMQEFADFIAGPLESPVVDKTGLTGRYDFSLDFKNYLPTDESAGRPDTAAIFMTAFKGELGLKLEAQKVTVEVMVVTHVEKPTPN